MVSQPFDYVLASYAHLSEVKKTEIEAADLVTIRGFIPGGIYHSSAVLWSGDITGTDTPETFIRSKKERKAVIKNKKQFEKDGYHFQVVSLNEELFRSFKLLYEQTTLQRQRAINYDVDSILDKIRTGTPSYLVGMFKEDILISGLAFSVKKNKASVSFGAKHKYEDKRGGVGGVLELELVRFCQERGIVEIGHGKSPNPAGLTGSSGIFEFKTRYGYSAFPTGSWQTTFIHNPNIALSDLVFVTVVDNRIGYLVISDKLEKDIRKRYQTKEVNAIQVVSTSTVKSQYQTLVNSL